MASRFPHVSGAGCARCTARRGYDAGKNVKGSQATHRGRYPAVDLGRSRAVSRDLGSDGGAICSTVIHWIQVVFAVAAYRGTLLDGVRQMFHWSLTLVNDGNGWLFEVVPWRWRVERTFA